MTVFKCSWDMVANPSYLILYEGLAYPVLQAYSMGQWTLWVELPQNKPHGWPADCDAPVPDILLEYKGPVLRNGYEELRRNIDAWIRGERQFKGSIPVMPAKEEVAAPVAPVTQPVEVKNGPGRPKLQVLS
jgi:hypothetical protein